MNVVAIFAAGTAWGSLRQKVADLQHSTERSAADLRVDIGCLALRVDQHTRDCLYARNPPDDNNATAA
jgi:hypothetical protein